VKIKKKQNLYDDNSIRSIFLGSKFKSCYIIITLVDVGCKQKIIDKKFFIIAVGLPSFLRYNVWLSLVSSHIFFLLLVLEFELRASCLLGEHSLTWAMLPPILALVIFDTRSSPIYASCIVGMNTHHCTQTLLFAQTDLELWFSRFLASSHCAQTLFLILLNCYFPTRFT
jgi:hypothetical protein